MKTFLSIILFVTSLLITSVSVSAADTLTTSGIKYIQISKGNGAHPITNQKVKIIYSWKSSTGEIIASNELSKPFEFRIGDDKVISGLDEIIKTMCKGEELYCVIPAALGHREKSIKGYIDSNSILYIYLQIIDIK